MTTICRTCLKELSEDSVTFYLDSTDSNPSTITVRCKLAYCVPEMDLDVVPNAAICNSCVERLTLAHEFKNKCLETEGRIQSYIEQMGYVLTCIDLRDIVEQSKYFDFNARKPLETLHNESCLNSKDSSQEINAATIYDTNRNPIITSTFGCKEQKPQERSLDIKNLQCDTQSFFAVPKIAQLLASDENSWKCPQCSYTASSDLELRGHEKTHNPKLHKCSECDYSAPKRQTLIIHMRKHSTDEKMYKCGLCNYRGRLKFDLKAHMRVHTGEKPYKCLLCDYSSSHKTNLGHHMRVHTGQKPYRCKLCEYNSSHKRNLQNHVKMHTGERPFKCKPLTCAGAGIRAGEKLKPYSCPSAKMGFLNDILVHSREKPFQCFDCEFSTGAKNDLEEHVDVHASNKSYACTTCQKQFDGVENLKQHLKLHSEDSTEARSISDMSLRVGCENEMII